MRCYIPRDAHESSPEDIHDYIAERLRKSRGRKEGIAKLKCVGVWDRFSRVRTAGHKGGASTQG